MKRYRLKLVPKVGETIGMILAMIPNSLTFVKQLNLEDQKKVSEVLPMLTLTLGMFGVGVELEGVK